MNTIETNRTLGKVFNILKLTYGLVPIIAGLDKFTNMLTSWVQYLHPGIAALLPFSGHTFMIIVGVIEIAAGLIVLFRPSVGSYIVMAWLALIALSLVASGKFLDVAVRDLVMAVGAFSLAQVAKIVPAVKRDMAHEKMAFS